MAYLNLIKVWFGSVLFRAVRALRARGLARARVRGARVLYYVLLHVEGVFARFPVVSHRVLLSPLWVTAIASM